MPPGSNADPEYHGANLVWFYAVEEHNTLSGHFRRKTRESRIWTATGKKTIRRTRQ